MQRTEVQRVEQELERLAGDVLMGKFRSAARADVKLACALRGYFTLDDGRYLPYLKSRLRPAAAELVLGGRAEALEKLDQQEPFSQAFVEELLDLAIRSQVPESIVWLLKLKERRFGFSGRELTL